MKRIWSIKHSFFSPGTAVQVPVLFLAVFAQARTALAGEGLSRSFYPLMLTHELNPLAIYVWISAEISS